MSGEPRYDPVANPFAPGAGTSPPTLAGRSRQLEEASVALRRVRQGRSSQQLLVQGLRGVGKTVLLQAVSGIAEHHGYQVVRLEGDRAGDGASSLVRQCHRVLVAMRPTARVGRALRVLSSVTLSIAGAGVRVDAEPLTGVGDTGAPAEDLPELMVAVAAAAADHDSGLFLAVDEGQDLDGPTLAGVLGGLHRAAQDQVPMWAAMAGLPNLLGVAVKTKTYAERMFSVETLGPLDEATAARAVAEPAEELGVHYSADAVRAIVDHSRGYPYFLQAWAFHTWNVAIDDPVSAADVERADPRVRQHLDESFFAARLARVPPSALRYVQALAALGPGSHRSGAVADRLGMKVQQVSAIRDRLITDGVLFSESYGHVAFAVPDLDAYLRRTLTESAG